MFQKKSHPIKIKINYHTQALKNQNKKKIRKKKEAMLMPKKKKSDNQQCDCPEKEKKGQCCYPGKRENIEKNAT